MGKIIEVYNVTSTAKSIEFLSDSGDHDCHTVPARGKISIDEDSLVTTNEELIKRGLKLIGATPVSSSSSSSASTSTKAKSTDTSSSSSTNTSTSSASSSTAE